MIPFPTAIGSFFAATAVPAIVGLLVSVWAGKLVSQKYIAAFGLGVFLWFFVDTVEGTVNLDAASGLSGGARQVEMVVIFAVGLVVTAYLVRSERRGGLAESIGLGAMGVIAVAVGIHGFGEGSEFGAIAVQTSSTGILQAFGGTSEGLAYVLHKAIEPVMIGAVYSSFASRRGHGTPARELTALGLLFSIPSVVGASLGYLASYDSSVGYALGAGTSIVAAIFLARGTSPGEAGLSPKLAIALGAGFLLLYAAELVHY